MVEESSVEMKNEEGILSTEMEGPGDPESSDEPKSGPSAGDSFAEVESEQTEPGTGVAFDGEQPDSGNEKEEKCNSPSTERRESEDQRSAIEKQPYEFEKCTVQIAVQLLPEDGDAKGRPVLLGVRTHLDVPIVRVVRLSELGELPPPIIALVEQLKSELPAREQATTERQEKEKLESLQRRLKTAKPPRHSKPATPEKPKTVQTAPAPARSVLTANQRASAVDQAVDEKQQLAMF